MYKKKDLFGETDEIVMTQGELDYEREGSFMKGLAIGTGVCILVSFILLFILP